MPSPHQERGWDTTPPFGVLHGREGRSRWPRLSPEEARPFEQTCEGPPLPPPFKNKHSLRLTLARTLARRILPEAYVRASFVALREERRWKKRLLFVRMFDIQRRNIIVSPVKSWARTEKYFQSARLQPGVFVYLRQHTQAQRSAFAQAEHSCRVP